MGWNLYLLARYASSLRSLAPLAGGLFCANIFIFNNTFIFLVFHWKIDLNILFKIVIFCSLCLFSFVCLSIFLFLSLSLSFLYKFLSNSSPFCPAVQVSNICFRKISKIRKKTKVSSLINYAMGGHTNRERGNHVQ